MTKVLSYELHTSLTSVVNEVMLFMLYTKSHPFVRLWLLLHSRFVEAYYKNQTYENIFYLIHIPDRIINASIYYELQDYVVWNVFCLCHILFTRFISFVLQASSFIILFIIIFFCLKMLLRGSFFLES